MPDQPTIPELLMSTNSNSEWNQKIQKETMFMIVLGTGNRISRKKNPQQQQEMVRLNVSKLMVPS